MEIRITIPDDKAIRIFDALAAKHTYTGIAEDGSAQTKAQFAKQLLKDYILGEVREHEQATAAAMARRAVAELEF